MVGRVTLAKSTLAYIPSYVLQTMKLHQGVCVCVKIDKICRQFFWGSLESRKRVHLISWNKICRPNEEEGLDLRKLRI